MIPKLKPTKVTQDDLELAAELSTITTIKSLLDEFNANLVSLFDELIITAEQSNPVATYTAILETQYLLQNSTQLVQARLLEVLGEVEEEDAHEIADAQPEPEIAPEAIGEIDGDLVLGQEPSVIPEEEEQ